MPSVIFAFGASKGIGAVFVNLALQKGYKVVLFARSNPQALKADFVSVDFLNEAQLEAAILEKLNEYKSVDHLVFAQKYRGEPSFENEMQVSLKASIVAIELLKNSLSQSIVFLSSSCVNRPSSSQNAFYHAAKAGIDGLIKYYALALSKQKIRVNGVAPNITLKPENEKIYNEHFGLKNAYENLMPLGEMTKASDVAEAMLWLLGARAVTAEVVSVDSGAKVFEMEALAISHCK